MTLGLRSIGLCSYRYGNREMGQVGHADIEGADAKLFSSLFSFTMKTYRRASAAQLHDLHLAPGNAVNAGTKGFADGLFSGKAGGETIHLSPALLYLSLSEDAPQETFAVMLVDFAHAVYLNDVNTYCDVDSLRWG